MQGLPFLCLILLNLPALAAPPGAIVLWPGAPPGGAAPGPQRVSARGSITQVEQPYLIVHRPARPNGTAIVLVSGGGYAHIAAGRESGPAAAWLQARGVTAFELVYRLPREGGGVAAPFQDGQRAMRRASVPVALQQFRHGGHGWGLGKRGSEPAAWPPLLLAWLQSRGWMPQPAG